MLGLPVGLWLLDLQWDDAEVVGTISRRQAKISWEQSVWFLAANFGEYLQKDSSPGLAADCLFPVFISIVKFLSSAKVSVSLKADEFQSSFIPLLSFSFHVSFLSRHFGRSSLNWFPAAPLWPKLHPFLTSPLCSPAWTASLSSASFFSFLVFSHLLTGIAQDFCTQK